MFNFLLLLLFIYLTVTIYNKKRRESTLSFFGFLLENVHYLNQALAKKHFRLEE